MHILYKICHNEELLDNGNLSHDIKCADRIPVTANSSRYVHPFTIRNRWGNDHPLTRDETCMIRVTVLLAQSPLCVQYRAPMSVMSCLFHLKKPAMITYNLANMLSLKQDVHSCLALLPKRLAEVMSTLLNQGSWGGQLRLYMVPMAMNAKSMQVTKPIFLPLLHNCHLKLGSQ